MKIKPEQQCIFITGAAGGIGLATAHLFAERGWYVGGYDVNQKGLDALEQELGAENCTVGLLDVSDPARYANVLAEFSEATGGRLDLLFNNAGIGHTGPFDGLSLDKIQAVVNINLMGVLNGIHLSLELLKATPNSLCFSTASSSATFGMPNLAVYSATKHAVKGLTEALSIEFQQFDVRAADMLPGLIDTPLIEEEWRQNAPTEGMFRLLQASDVAATVWSAYNEDPDRLHWFIPEELRDLDKAAAMDPEGTRAQIIAEGLS